MVAIDDNASMLCARVMRGISSMENAVAPVRAIASTASGEPSGSAKPITVCPERSIESSAGAARTCKMMSAAENTLARDPICAPASRNAASVNPAAVPAFSSTTTPSPALCSAATAAGLSATRASPGHVSRGMPTVMALSLAEGSGVSKSSS